MTKALYYKHGNKSLMNSLTQVISAVSVLVVLLACNSKNADLKVAERKTDTMSCMKTPARFAGAK